MSRQFRETLKDSPTVTRWKRRLQYCRKQETLDYTSQLALSIKEVTRSGCVCLVKLITDLLPNDTSCCDDAFEKACETGNEELVDLLISKGATWWEEGLRGACKSGNRKLVELMMSKDIQSWYEGLNGACEGGHYDIVDLMLNNLQNRNIWIGNSIYWACRGGNVEIIDRLISFGITDWDVGLAGACFGGHLNIVQMMISNGANTWERGLEEACEGGWLDAAKLMVEKGAKQLQAPFYYACSSGNTELVEWLVSLGANDWQAGFEGACSECRPDVVNLIFRYNPETIDIDAAFSSAYSNGAFGDPESIEVIKILLDRGVSLNLIENAYAEARQYGDIDLVELLETLTTFEK